MLAIVTEIASLSQDKAESGAADEAALVLKVVTLAGPAVSAKVVALRARTIHRRKTHGRNQIY